MNFQQSPDARLTPIDPPEPDLTPAAMIARATALRSTLREAQAECEAQGRVSDAINNELIRAASIARSSRGSLAATSSTCRFSIA